MAEKARMQKIDEQLPPKTQVLKKSNLRSLWILNEQLIKVFESEDYGEYEKGYEIYPAVAFIGYIALIA